MAPSPRMFVLSILPDRAVRTPGWSFLLDTSKFANGMHQLSAVATSEDGQRASISRNIEVANWSATNPIQISIGKPSSADGALSGTVPAGGWAISNTAPITTVSLAVDGKPIGQAAYGGKRSDVCEVLPGRPGCPNVGWNICSIPRKSAMACTTWPYGCKQRRDVRHNECTYYGKQLERC